jgi:hypothetical protein
VAGRDPVDPAEGTPVRVGATFHKGKLVERLTTGNEEAVVAQ